MKNYFEDITVIAKDNLLSYFTEHESVRPGGKDLFAHDIIKRLTDDTSMQYFKGKLTDKAFSNIVLPHHEHDASPVPPGGKLLNEIIANNELFRAKLQTDCVKKISAIKQVLFHNKPWQPGFLLLSNNKELVHPGHYHNNYDSNKLYIANGFHRLVAYGLAIREVGFFVPIEVYLCYSTVQ